LVCHWLQALPSSASRREADIACSELALRDHQSGLLAPSPWFVMGVSFHSHLARMYQAAGCPDDGGPAGMTPEDDRIQAVSECGYRAAMRSGRG
jgi:hypothetical protein